MAIFAAVRGIALVLQLRMGATPFYVELQNRVNITESRKETCVSVGQRTFFTWVATYIWCIMLQRTTNINNICLSGYWVSPVIDIS